MRKQLFLGMAGLALFGAGCGSTDSPVSLDKYTMPTNTEPVATAPYGNETAPPESTPPTPEPPTPATTTVQTNSSVTSTTPPMTEPKKPLAFPGILPSAETANKFIHIKTTKGNIVFQLLPQEGPKAASNFVYLTKLGFYNGLTFHRVVPGFVIQGGDPRGDGTGDPGYKFQDDPVHLPYNEGIVAMANSGPNTNGSQFFIMLADNPLPPNYSVFGRVTSGMDVVKQIQVGDIMTTVDVENKK